VISQKLKAVHKEANTAAAPTLQLGLRMHWRRKVKSARIDLNQPLVTTGGGTKNAISAVSVGESHFDLGQRLLSQKPRLSMLQENLFLKTWKERMIRVIAVAFAVALASSAQAIPLAPIERPDSMVRYDPC
jgi:hypothetical protein